MRAPFSPAGLLPPLFTLLLTALLMTGCAIDPMLQTAPPADPETHWPEPVATDEFTLDPGQDVIGELQVIRAHEEDTLSDIARRFNVGYEEIVAANPGVDPWLPGAGTEIVVPTQWILPNVKREGIVINLAAMRLFYFPPRKKNELQTVITHPVGIGRVGWNTPQGRTRVSAKVEAPTWVPTVAIRKEHEENGDPLPASVPPGPDNPMGTHVLRLGWPEYAIHGTDKPPSIGLRGTHGCLRMYPEDIVVMYEQVKVGTPVTVVNEPVLTGYRGDTLMLQTYPVLEDDKRDHAARFKGELKRARTLYSARNETSEPPYINKKIIKEMTANPRALTMPVSDSTASLEQALATVSRVKNRLPSDANWSGEGDVTVEQPIASVMPANQE